MSKEMPRYISHKTVHALKIKNVIENDEGQCILVFEEEDYSPIAVSSAFRKKYDPKEGGYFIIDQDGNMSWNSAEEFEATNSLIGMWDINPKINTCYEIIEKCEKSQKKILAEAKGSDSKQKVEINSKFYLMLIPSIIKVRISVPANKS